MRKTFFLLGAIAACGGTTTDTDDAGDAASDLNVVDVKKDVTVIDASYPDAPGEPPPLPDGGTPTTNVYTFAMNTIFLGEADRMGGAPSSTAWKSYGYDIDGLVTTSSSTNVCTLAAGAPKVNQVDGNGGIDNAWGDNILPIMQSASSSPTPSKTETTSIDAGDFTLQIQVVGLSDDPHQSATGLSAQIFSSGQYSGTPAFDSTTDWPVLSTSLIDGTTIASGSTVQFDGAYITDGTFVSGPSSSPVTFNLLFGGVALPLVIRDAVLTFDHTAPGDATNGTIAGVMKTTELNAALKAVAGRISVSLCGSAFDGIAQQITEASDILSDGTNVMGTPCDGISIGIGFNAKLVKNPTMVAIAPSMPPDPCGD